MPEVPYGIVQVAHERFRALCGRLAMVKGSVHEQLLGRLSEMRRLWPRIRYREWNKLAIECKLAVMELKKAKKLPGKCELCLSLAEAMYNPEKDYKVCLLCAKRFWPECVQQGR